MSIHPPAPIAAVLFDFHATLVDQGDAGRWLATAWRRSDRPGTPAEGLGAAAADELTAYLHHIWEHSRVVDPDNRRDYDPGMHRQVWDATLARQPHGDPSRPGLPRLPPPRPATHLRPPPRRPPAPSPPSSSNWAARRRRS